MFEKLLLYDNQQPSPLILLRNTITERFRDYPKGVHKIFLWKRWGISLFIKKNVVSLQKIYELLNL